MWWIVLKIALTVIGLYIAAAAAFMLSARLKKDADGNLILDPESWHFKAAYPFRKFNIYAVKYLSGRISVCGYFRKLFLMLFMGWPILIALAVFKTLTYAPFMLLFGYYPIADHLSIHESWGYGDGDSAGPFAVHAVKISLPEFRGYQIFPVYLIIPLAYLACWMLWPGIAAAITVTALTIAIGIVIVAGVLMFAMAINKTHSGTIGIVKEYVSSKKKGVCRLMIVRSSKNPNYM